MGQFSAIISDDTRSNTGQEPLNTEKRSRGALKYKPVPRQCPICLNWLKYGDRCLQRHIRQVHGFGPCVPCTQPNCLVTFTRKEDRKKHLRRVHKIYEHTEQEKEATSEMGGNLEHNRVQDSIRDAIRRQSCARLMQKSNLGSTVNQGDCTKPLSNEANEDSTLNQHQEAHSNYEQTDSAHGHETSEINHPQANFNILSEHSNSTFIHSPNLEQGVSTANQEHAFSASHEEPTYLNQQQTVITINLGPNLNYEQEAFEEEGTSYLNQKESTPAPSSESVNQNHTFTATTPNTSLSIVTPSLRPIRSTVNSSVNPLKSTFQTASIHNLPLELPPLPPGASSSLQEMRDIASTSLSLAFSLHSRYKLELRAETNKQSFHKTT